MKDPRLTNIEAAIGDQNRKISNLYSAHIDPIRDKITNLRRDWREIATAAISACRPDIDDVNFGNWECDDSPTGQCVYDADWDDCVFCHGPEERK
jgi:hypothetical protein